MGQRRCSAWDHHGCRPRVTGVKRLATGGPEGSGGGLGQSDEARPERDRLIWELHRLHRHGRLEWAGERTRAQDVLPQRWCGTGDVHPREKRTGGLDAVAAHCPGHKESRPVQVAPPLGTTKQQRCRWYCSQHLVTGLPTNSLNRLSSALQASGCAAVAAAIGQPCPRITNLPPSSTTSVVPPRS